MQTSKNYDEKIELLRNWEINPAYPLQNNDLVKVLFFSSKEKRIEYLLDWGIYPNLRDYEINNPLYLNKETLALAKENINEANINVEEFKKSLAASLVQIPKKVDFTNIYREIGKIHIVPFLQKIGYTVSFPTNKNSSNAKKMLDERKAKGVTLDINNERYIIYNDSNQVYKLFKRDESFKGDLIEFIEKIHYGNYVSSKESKLEAINFIKNNWGMGDVEDYKFNNNPIIKTNSKIVEKEYTKLLYPQYLVSRGLSFRTLTSKEIYPSLGNSYVKGQPNRQNTIFKMRNFQNDLFSVMEKNKNLKGSYEKNKTTHGMLFVSINEEPINKLVIAETTLDVLSILELNKYDISTTKVCSPNGQVNDGQLEFIKRILEENEDIETIVLANDKDYQGQFYNFKYLKMLYELQNNKQEDIENNIIDALNEIKKISVDKTLDKEVKNTLKKDIIEEINQKLVSSIDKKVELLISNDKDFNDDLMAAKGLTRENILESVKTEKDIYYLSNLIKTGYNEKIYLENMIEPKTQKTYER